MKIAIAFDATWTKDPELWKKFAQMAKLLDHEVIVITNSHEKRQKFVEELVLSGSVDIPIHYAFQTPKKTYAQNHGIHVDVWIDDDPLSIVS